MTYPRVQVKNEPDVRIPPRVLKAHGEGPVGFFLLVRTSPGYGWETAPPDTVRRAFELDAAYYRNLFGAWSHLPCWLSGRDSWPELLATLTTWLDDENELLRGRFKTQGYQLSVAWPLGVPEAGRAHYFPALSAAERPVSAVTEPYATVPLFTWTPNNDLGDDGGFDTASWQPRKPPHGQGGEGV